MITDDAGDPRLAPVLARLVASAQQAWPGLEVSTAGFYSHLLARIPANAQGEDRARVLESLNSNDLYLACACVARCPAALAAFETGYIAEVERAYHRIRPERLDLDDARQLLRQTFLVATETRPPKIAEYAGRGALKAWVRVVAVSSLIDSARARTHLKLETGGEDALAATAAATPDPELQFLKAKYGHEFRVSVEEAFAELTAKDRNLLRHSVVEGLTIDQVSELYSIHRATAARWISSARERFYRHARKILARRIAVGQGELQSILRIIQSELHITLDRVLAG